MMFVFKNRKIKGIACVLLIFFVSQITVFAQADLVIVNADVRTIDKTKPRAEAVAVVKNRISAVGSNREIRALISENTKIIDAEGKLVLPGFNDAHVHFLAMGNQFFHVDLRDARSPREMAEKVRFHARFIPAGQWIIGSGWNEENWAPNDFPTKELIDAATSDHPVFLYHANPKIALVNSLALRQAKIDKADKTAFNGGIGRNTNGEINGILKDAAVGFVRRFAPSFTTDKSLFAETAGNYAVAFGVTSVQDVSSDDSTEIFRALWRQGKLKTRVYDCSGDWRKLAQSGVKRAEGDAFIRRGCLKSMADGDDELTEALYKEISAADKAGLQIAIHAIGARSNAQILSIFERVIKENGVRDRRFRVEHAHGFYPQDIRRFAASGIIASVQPFLFSDGAGRTLDPLRDLVKSGASLAFGSDATMVEVNPLLGIAAAVNAADPKQKITVEEAVRFYTLESAYAEFQENEKGSITVGKLADFVILSNDIFTINPGEISKTRVLTTIVDGRVVYEAK